MKAVVYHADHRFAWGEDVGDSYQRLFRKFVPMCHDFGMSVVHLTTEGHPGWGDENDFFKLNPKNVVANREEVFTEFLSKNDGVFWFTEPDFRIFQMWPELTTDCAMLYREDRVPLTPAWRMATQKALPFFVECRDEMRKEHRKDWHGDSDAFTRVWHTLGKPRRGVTDFRGISIEFRNYLDYVKGRATYSRNYLGEQRKKSLLDAER